VPWLRRLPSRLRVPRLRRLPSRVRWLRLRQHWGGLRWLVVGWLRWLRRVRRPLVLAPRPQGLVSLMVIRRSFGLLRPVSIGFGPT
jgi:hypothetical protein